MLSTGTDLCSSRVAPGGVVYMLLEIRRLNRQISFRYAFSFHFRELQRLHFIVTLSESPLVPKGKFAGHRVQCLALIETDQRPSSEGEIVHVLEKVPRFSDASQLLDGLLERILTPASLTVWRLPARGAPVH